MDGLYKMISYCMVNSLLYLNLKWENGLKMAHETYQSLVQEDRFCILSFIGLIQTCVWNMLPRIMFLCMLISHSAIFHNHLILGPNCSWILLNPYKECVCFTCPDSSSYFAVVALPDIQLMPQFCHFEYSHFLIMPYGLRVILLLLS